MKTYKVIRFAGAVWRTVYQNEAFLKAKVYYNAETTARPGEKIQLVDPEGKPIKQNFSYGG